MEIVVYRKYKKEDYTVGQLFIDGVKVCNTMEDTDRGLDEDMQEWMIKNKKIPSRTAIPTGRYEVRMDIVSPKFSQKPLYQEICNGKVPRLMKVKGFEGILIHCGNTHANSAGCILVGQNTVKGKLTDSEKTFRRLYADMKAAHDRGEKIYITIE